MRYFKGTQFKKDIILVVALYYCRFSLSYRDVSELLKERGVSVHPTTIMRWVHEYGNLIYQIWKKNNKSAHFVWHLDKKINNYTFDLREELMLKMIKNIKTKKIHSFICMFAFTIFLGIQIILNPVGVKVAIAEQTECFNSHATIPPEESLSENLVPHRILVDSQFNTLVANFRTELCAQTNIKDVQKVINNHGTQLWKIAIDRAQGKRDDLGETDRYDDRPLYWARISMSKAIHQWTPQFSVSHVERNQFLHELEYTSRGISSINFLKEENVKRVLVSGFDPFGFENDIRSSNPSGATALQLDGIQVNTPKGKIVIQAVNFPVRWEDFEDGIVEDTFGPVLNPYAMEKANLIMTLSEGRPGKMVLEGYAGRWHAGRDNNLKFRENRIPPAPHWPVPSPIPEFIETTLPINSMINDQTGPWPVVKNNNVCEKKAPHYINISCNQNGPSPDSQAVEGSGGAFLSNESMYRSNLVKMGLQASNVPGGHLHVAGLREFYPKEKRAYTDSTFSKQRKIIINQAMELVKSAARAVN